jgi:hypothetical protein
MKHEHLALVELPSVRLLREGVVQRHVAIHPDALAQLPGLLPLGANRGGHVRDIVVRRADDQHGARPAVRVPVGLRLPPRLGHRPRPIHAGHLSDCAHRLKLFKATRRLLPQRFDRLPVHR